MGPFPPNEVSRIAQHFREEKRKEGKNRLTLNIEGKGRLNVKVVHGAMGCGQKKF